MEMNTRLQVEHPVTEEITGVDLVEWQLRVASGEVLPKRQDELAIKGWAMEARLYAEDPAKGFLPSVGTIEHLHWNGDFQDWYRLETAVVEGDEISPFYDPMIAKIVVRGESRLEACDNLASALDELNIWPLKSNAAFLYKLATFEPFRVGTVDTGLIQRHTDELTAPPPVDGDSLSWWAQLLVPKTPHFGFRLNAPRKETSYLLVDDETTEVRLFGPGNDMEKRSAAFVAGEGRTVCVTNWRNDGAGHHHAHDGDILSPMPGKIIAVEVTQGQAVTKGQKLLTLEAMKMEHTLTAPFDGVVAELAAVAGAQVQVEALLARIEASD
jgi:3-methylcrotonyl-CoA carboxylase alpha subunit